jgi:hypothetical protein
MTQHPDHSQIAQDNAHAQQRTCSKERANRIRYLTEAQKVRTKFKDDSEVEGHSFSRRNQIPSHRIDISHFGYNVIALDYRMDCGSEIGLPVRLTSTLVTYLCGDNS